MEVSLVALSACPESRRGPDARYRLSRPARHSAVPDRRTARPAKRPCRLASLGLYLLRMLIHIHVWSFRLPDAPQPREPPAPSGLRAGSPASPRSMSSAVGRPRNGMPVMVRLTHYPVFQRQQRNAARSSRDYLLRKEADVDGTPILLIHGYSASGTTFAHHAVQTESRLPLSGSAAGTSGSPTCARAPACRTPSVPWTLRRSRHGGHSGGGSPGLRAEGAQRIDVFAHCMGSAMLSMALLGSEVAKTSRSRDLRHGAA